MKATEQNPLEAFERGQAKERAKLERELSILEPFKIHGCNPDWIHVHGSRGSIPSVKFDHTDPAELERTWEAFEPCFLNIVRDSFLHFLPVFVSVYESDESATPDRVAWGEHMRERYYPREDRISDESERAAIWIEIDDFETSLNWFAWVNREPVRIEFKLSGAGHFARLRLACEFEIDRQNGGRYAKPGSRHLMLGDLPLDRGSAASVLDPDGTFVGETAEPQKMWSSPDTMGSWRLTFHQFGEGPTPTRVLDLLRNGGDWFGPGTSV